MARERKRKQSAGTLLYRQGPEGLEVLLVHPSGNYNRQAPWSIPKGLVDSEDDLESTARRETVEETGVTPAALTYLGFIDYQKSAKSVHCFAGPAPAGAIPRCASWEVDQARFVTLARARELLHLDQQKFLDEVLALIDQRLVMVDLTRGDGILVGSTPPSSLPWTGTTRGSSMLSITGRGVRLCDGITRREALRIGGLGFTGLMWSDWLRGRAVAAGRKPPAGHFGKARACILIFNYGGPSHIDTWDLKPDAPREIRGEFKPIATRIPGVSITEHLPRLAALADRYAILRSVTHRDNDHAIGAYLALTGYSHPKNAILGIEPPATPLDMPSLGSVISKLRPASKPVFPYVTLGDLRHFGNNDSMGQNAGCLGKVHDPFMVPFVRPLNGTLDDSSVTSVMGTVESGSLKGRRQLLAEMTQAGPALEATAGMRNLDNFTKRACELLASSATRDAFDLTREPAKVRDSYGADPFAQNCLLSRRLVEAGVPMVTVYSVGNRDWDTHGNNFNNLKNTLLPAMDRGVSALLNDLAGRRLLDETLVVWMGDMGRTPRINTSAGRDHWSFCYSIVMAGAGVRGGQVFGSSDRSAAYPSTNPVGPGDVAATIYHLLGIDPQAHVTDQQGRPFTVSTGAPIKAILG